MDIKIRKIFIFKDIFHEGTFIHLHNKNNKASDENLDKNSFNLQCDFAYEYVNENMQLKEGVEDNHK